MEVENRGQIKTSVLSKLPFPETNIAPEHEWLEE